MDLVEILKRPEGKTLEFKRDLSSPDGALKTIVAFANTAGGTLLVGVEDRSPNASPGFMTSVREKKPSTTSTGMPGGRCPRATSFVIWSRTRTTSAVAAAGFMF